MAIFLLVVAGLLVLVIFAQLPEGIWLGRFTNSRWTG